MHGIAQCANGRYPNANIFLPLGHQQEHFQHGRGVFQEDVGLDHVDPSINQSESFVQRFHGRLLLSDNVFLEILQDDVVNFRQGHDVAIVMLHEQLNSGFALGVHEPKTLGQLALSGKVQLVFLTSGQGVQSVSNPPKKAHAVPEPSSLNVRQHLQSNQFFDVCGSKLSIADPKRGVDIAQASGGGFNVGFQVVVDIVVVTMARHLFVPFGDEKIFNRPDFAVL